MLFSRATNEFFYSIGGWHIKLKSCGRIFKKYCAIGSVWPGADLRFCGSYCSYISNRSVSPELFSLSLLCVPIGEKQCVRGSFLLTDSSQWPLLRNIEENETEQRGAQVEGPQVKYTCMKGLKKIPLLSHGLAFRRYVERHRGMTMLVRGRISGFSDHIPGLHLLSDRCQIEKFRPDNSKGLCLAFGWRFCNWPLPIATTRNDGRK